MRQRALLLSPVNRRRTRSVLVALFVAELAVSAVIVVSIALGHLQEASTATPPREGEPANAAERPTPSPLPTCADLASVASLPAASVAPTPAPSRPLPSTPPPGRLVFRTGERLDRLLVYESGRVREWPLGEPALSVALSPDGERVAAVLAGSRTFWTLSIRDGTTTRLPLSIPAATPQTFDLSFSPDLSWFFYVPSFDPAESELFLVNSATGAVTRSVIPGGWLHSSRWRSNSEMVVLTGPKPEIAAVPQTYPGRFFTWRGAAEPVEIGKADFSGGVSSTPDGRVVYAARLPNGTPLLRALGSTEPLLSPEGLFASREGCGLQYRTSLRMRPPTWSADGAQVAVVGNGNNLTAGFVAIRPSAGGPVGVFRSPDSCYIQQSAWSGPRYLVMLTGPDCGQTTRDGRLIVLDAKAHVLAEHTVDRKAFFAPSTDGRWVASATEGGWQFIQLDPPNERIVVPLGGTLDGWCCP